MKIPKVGKKVKAGWGGDGEHLQGPAPIKPVLTLGILLALHLRLSKHGLNPNTLLGASQSACAVVPAITLTQHQALSVHIPCFPVPCSSC